MGNLVSSNSPPVQENNDFSPLETSSSLRDMPDSYFKTGSYVRVINNLKYVKYVQEAFGGWDSDMAKCINQICIISKVDHDRTIVIKGPSKTKFYFNRAALEAIKEDDYDKMVSSSLVSSTMISRTFDQSTMQSSPLRCLSESIAKPSNYKIGETLIVSTNEKLIQEKQQGCGGYSRLRMKDLMGKPVKVKYCSGTYVKVEKDGKDYDLHPDILNYQPLTENLNEAKLDNIENKNVELFQAVLNGDVDKFFRSKDMDLNIQNNHGMTLINEACCHGKLGVVKALIELGVDLNYLPDHEGNFPIHNCAIRSHLEILKFLIEKFPASLNNKTRNDRSLLDIARELKNEELEKYLLSKEVPPNPVMEPIQPEPPQIQIENECIICRDATVGIVFLCGHVACRICAYEIFRCHICSTDIEKRIPLFL